MPFRAPLRAGSRWGPCSQEPPRRANRPLKERSPSLHEPSGKFASLRQVLRAGDKPPSKAVGLRRRSRARRLRPSRGQGMLLLLVSSSGLSPPGQQASRPWRGFAAWWSEAPMRGSLASAAGAIPAASVCPSKPPEMERGPPLQETPAKKEVHKWLK